MEIKLELNGKIDDSGVDFDNLDYTNADDIANGSKGIFSLYIYNKTTKKIGEWKDCSTGFGCETQGGHSNNDLRRYVYVYNT